MKFTSLFTTLMFLSYPIMESEASSCCGCEYSFTSSTDTPRKLSKKEIADLKAKGGEVYETYGDAWHPLRYQKEFTAAQWKTILLQKRIRVPLTAEDQRALSELLVGD